MALHEEYREFRSTHRDTWCHVPYVLTSSKLQLQAIDNLVRGASRGDVFVFYCTVNSTLLSLVDHVTDAGHCGHDDDDQYQCA